MKTHTEYETDSTGTQMVPTNGGVNGMPPDKWQMPQYEADPTDAFGSHFDNFGRGIGAPEEVLKTGSDLIELIVRSRLPKDQKGPMTTLFLTADCEEMIEQTGSLSLATYNRMAGAYTLAFSIGEEGAARKEFVQSIIGDRTRFMDQERERPRGFFGHRPPPR